MGSLVAKLYQLDCEPVVTEQASEQGNDMDLWHQRLGHVNVQQLKEITQKEIATGVKIPKGANISFCEGNMFNLNLRLVHIDVCGPIISNANRINWWTTVLCNPY